MSKRVNWHFNVAIANMDLFLALSMLSICLMNVVESKLCAWRHNMPRPSPPPPPSRRNVAVVSHAEYVPTLTVHLSHALRPR